MHARRQACTAAAARHCLAWPHARGCPSAHPPSPLSLPQAVSPVSASGAAGGFGGSAGAWHGMAWHDQPHTDSHVRRSADQAQHSPHDRKQLQHAFDTRTDVGMHVLCADPAPYATHASSSPSKGGRIKRHPLGGIRPGPMGQWAHFACVHAHFQPCMQIRAGLHRAAHAAALQASYVARAATWPPADHTLPRPARR